MEVSQQEIIVGINEEDTPILEQAMGEEALKFLEETGCQLQRNITLERQQFASPTYQFVYMGKKVEFTTLNLPLVALKQINTVPIPAEMKTVTGMYINFYFEDPKAENQSTEVYTKIQPGSIAFAHMMITWLKLMKSDIVMAPSDERRENAYAKNKFLQKIDNKHIFLIEQNPEEE